jgi:hypothetical protein
MTPRLRILPVCFIVLVAGVAQATIYPSPYILSNWVEKTNGVKVLHVRQKTTVYDSKFPDGSVTVDEEIWFRRPGEYRRSTVYPNGKLDIVVGKDRAVKVWAGKAESASLVDSLGLLGGVYLFGDKGRLNAFLRQAGIDLGQTRWTLKDRQIGVEIGDPRSVRVVFSKQDFVPIGVEAGDRSYRFDAGIPSRFPARYPAFVEVSVAGRLVEKIVVQSVEVNVPVADVVFEVPRLRPTPDKK